MMIMMMTVMMMVMVMETVMMTVMTAMTVITVMEIMQEGAARPLLAEVGWCNQGCENGWSLRMSEPPKLNDFLEKLSCVCVCVGGGGGEVKDDGYEQEHSTPR